MAFPRNLETDFELIEEFPHAKMFNCFSVKDRRKDGARAFLRQLPSKESWKKPIVDNFHSFFTTFGQITNRSFIPSVYSVNGTVGRSVYVVEEYFPGEPLTQFIERNSDSDLLMQDVSEILVKVCEALHHAHQRRIYHLCITPDDILVDRENIRKVKLVGFGLQIYCGNGLQDSIPSNVARFVAPEVISGGSLDASSDVYSLGSVILDLLPDLGQSSDFLESAISRKPSDRAKSAREFAAGIKSLASLKLTINSEFVHHSAPRLSGGIHPVVRIFTQPEGATLTLDGRKIGTTGPSGLTVIWKQDALLEIDKSGYDRETVTFKEPPADSTITVKLKSSFRLFTNPWGASVKVNGLPHGITDRNGLLINCDERIVVEVQKDGYQTETLQFSSPPKEEHVLELKILKPKLEPKEHPHEVRLKTDPIGAQVFVNYKLVGTTTESGIKISKDSARIVEIEKSGYKKQIINHASLTSKKDFLVKLFPETPDRPLSDTRSLAGDAKRRLPVAEITLYTFPAGASVRLNNWMYGTTSEKGLVIPWIEGSIITVEKYGFETQFLSFDQAPGSRVYSIALRELKISGSNDRKSIPSPNNQKSPSDRFNIVVEEVKRKIREEDDRFNKTIVSKRTVLGVVGTLVGLLFLKMTIGLSWYVFIILFSLIAIPLLIGRVLD